MLYYRCLLCVVTAVVHPSEVVIVVVGFLVTLMTLVHWRLRPLSAWQDRRAILVTNVFFVQIVLIAALLYALRGRMSAITEKVLNALIVAFVILGVLATLVFVVLRLREAKQAHHERAVRSMPLMAPMEDVDDDDGVDVDDSDVNANAKAGGFAGASARR